MIKFLPIFFLLMLNFNLHSQHPGWCDVRGDIKIDSNSVCLDYLPFDLVKAIFVKGDDKKVRPEFEGDFRIKTIQQGEQELCAIHYNCYSYELDTTCISFTCKTDQIVTVDLVIDSECPYDAEMKTCPKCQKEDQVIPIVYKKTTRRLQKKSFKDKIVLGGENYAECKPYWFCRRDSKSF